MTINSLLISVALITVVSCSKHGKGSQNVPEVRPTTPTVEVPGEIEPAPVVPEVIVPNPEVTPPTDTTPVITEPTGPVVVTPVEPTPANPTPVEPAPSNPGFPSNPTIPGGKVPELELPENNPGGPTPLPPEDSAPVTPAPSTPEETDPATTPEVTDLKDLWNLETGLNKILDSIKRSPVYGVSFNSNDSWTLDRPLTSSEILKGQELSKKISEDIDSKTGTSIASQFLSDYKRSLESSSKLCASNKEPIVKGFDGNLYVIYELNKKYVVRGLDGIVSFLDEKVFNNYNQACRSITESGLGLKYATLVVKHEELFFFPVAYRNSDDANKLGSIQSAKGIIVAEYCQSSGKKDDQIKKEICH